jgi:hypothetical protein
VAEWQLVRVTGSHVQAQRQRAEYRADARGVYRLCGVPVNYLLMIGAQSEQGTAAPFQFRVPVNHRYATTDIVLATPPN